MFNLADPSFWVAVAFVIFMALIIWKAVPGMLKSLDERGNGIRGQLDEARQLREDSEKLLAEYQRKHSQAMEDADRILANAKQEAKSQREKASMDLDALLERREKSASDKIAQAEANATQEVRSQAVAQAIAATRELMMKNLTNKDDDDLIAGAIKELPQRLQ